MDENPVRILLVEDNPGDVRLIAEALKAAQFACRIHHVEDGEEAMQFIRAEPPYDAALHPELIILDLNLPRVDGGVLLDAIAAHPRFEDVPVVLFSSSRSPKDMSRADRVSFGVYIVKPADLDSYLDVGGQVRAFWEACNRDPRRAVRARS